MNFFLLQIQIYCYQGTIIIQYEQPFQLLRSAFKIPELYDQYTMICDPMYDSTMHWSKETLEKGICTQPPITFDMVVIFRLQAVEFIVLC